MSNRLLLLALTSATLVARPVASQSARSATSVRDTSNRDTAAPRPSTSAEPVVSHGSTLLDQTDLVFLDPVGTGYSRPTKPEYGPKFWGVDEDVRSVGEFIRLFLVKYERWGSPKFIGGESYGTTRAAHLSGWLVDNGIALNGVMMISATAFAAQDGDSRALAFFPSYAGIAWYHERLGADLQLLPVAKVVEQAQNFADGPVPHRSPEGHTSRN